MASSATIVWSAGGPVEGRGDDLALDRPLEVGDLFRPLVDEHDHQVALGVVGGDRVGDRLHDHRLAGLGRRHDQAALALADRGDDVDDPADQVARLGLEAQPLTGVERGQLGELDAVLGGLGVGAVDRVDAHHRVELLLALALAGLAHLADDRVTAAQTVLADHRQRDVDVVGAGQVAAGADERVVVQHVEDARGRGEDVVLEDRGVGLAALGGALRAVGGAVTTPAATATAAPALPVVVPVALVLLALTLLLLAVLAALVLLAVVRPVVACRSCWLPVLLAARPVLAGVLLAAAVAGPVVTALALLAPALAVVGPMVRTVLGGLVRRVGLLGGLLGRLLVGLLARAVLVAARLRAAAPATGLSARLPAGLGSLDRLDELRLLHRAGSTDPETAGHRLQVGQQHGVESTRPLLRGLRRAVRGATRGVRRGGFDGFRHVRSFPRISAARRTAGDHLGFLLPRPGSAGMRTGSRWRGRGASDGGRSWKESCVAVPDAPSR